MPRGASAARSRIFWGEYSPGRRRWERRPRRWDGMIFGEGLEMYARRAVLGTLLVHEREKGKTRSRDAESEREKITERNWRSASRQERASQVGWSLPDCSRKVRGTDVDYKQEDAAGPGGEATGAKSCMTRSNVRLKPSHAEVDRQPSKGKARRMLEETGSVQPAKMRRRIMGRVDDNVIEGFLVRTNTRHASAFWPGPTLARSSVQR
ncbi:hypothetical protein BJY00DRAFT_111189 [Aspergillus carlsbadensis]|nr:hypothetical protein BJY00DRAFT_111189 [Aspergillus carlsbadensis]